MEKLEIKSGYNQVSVNSNLSGTGTTESPIGYTGDFQHTDKRSLLWESTGNDYNTDITLSEPVTHFDQIMVYGSGLESYDTMHVSKNVYRTQDKLMGCDTWCYSPWTTSFQANYILAANLKISGNSGHIGGSTFWGIGSKNATWAAGKWTGTEAPKMLMPWKIFGIGRHPTYNFYALPSEGGSVSSNINSGYSGDIATITAIPESEVWRQSALNITGAELTGNDFMFGNSNVTAQAEFEHSRELTLENGDHGVLSADKMSGFSGDVVTVDTASIDEGWYFTGLNITGAVATGNKFTFIGNNVTAEGLYTDEGYPVTYLSDEHVSLTGDVTIFIPGSEGITLDSGYDTYYRISGYDITNGSIIDGKLVPTGPCTIKAVETPNYFTATGNFEKGSNVTCDAGTNYGGGTTYTNVGQKYALHVSHTGDIPASWYSTSNRWNPSNASSYSITLNAKMTFTGRISPDYSNAAAYMTGVTLVGSTQNQSQTFSVTTYATAARNYSKTVTTTTQSTYGVSGRLGSQKNSGGGITRRGIATYIATGTTGTWTATGIAP